ncbi:MAG: hypothetical protein JXA57_12935 [Armatimonadetes bacterium]|nr:hypothetical protein [Armatimonadota bacterium]
MTDVEVLLNEKLLPIKEKHLPVKGDRLDWRDATHGRPGFGGVYVLWWRGTGQEFYRLLRNRELRFAGPNGSLIVYDVRECDLPTAPNGYLPLYVGKNAADIAKRIGLHLKLKTARTVTMTGEQTIPARLTTTCQVRDRLDRLFPDMPDTRRLVGNLALSYVKLDGPEHFAERFFLEDLAIGRLRSLVNLDSER